VHHVKDQLEVGIVSEYVRRLQCEKDRNRSPSAAAITFDNGNNRKDHYSGESPLEKKQVDHHEHKVRAYEHQLEELNRELDEEVRISA
jgi:hypothetical protein